MRSGLRVAFWLTLSAVSAFSCAPRTPTEELPGGDLSAPSVPRGGARSGEREITILATNDIHGGVESRIQNGVPTGGMALWGGTVKAIRRSVESRLGNRGGVVLVDAGDQFQGTLLSNYDEGQLVFRLLADIGYDAVIPGNHDYDFGPEGWLEDRVRPGNPDQNPRGALERLVAGSPFPLLGANTFLKESLVDEHGRAVETKSVGCAPVRAGQKINWSRARRPEFLRPWLIRTVADVRVALIGIESELTPKATVEENVADLCFRDEAESYLEVRRELEGKADVFVVIMHLGNSANTGQATALVRKIVKSRRDAVHAAITGHTHFITDTDVDGVPLIQSGAGGDRYGRVDLVWSFERNSVLSQRTRKAAGVKIRGDAVVDGTLIVPDSRIEDRIRVARLEVEPMASRRIGTAESEIARDRIDESPLANAMTDVLRTLSGAEISMLNTGSLRAQIAAGDVTYEDLFRVFPFSNRAVLIGPMTGKQLESVLERSAKTCGSYGAVMQSGLRIRYSRDCSVVDGGIDRAAKLLRVETLGGEILLDRELGIAFPETRVFRVATLDFLHDGGSGFDAFVGTPLIRDLGIFRELVTDLFLTRPARFTARTDGRWKQVAR